MNKTYELHYIIDIDTAEAKRTAEIKKVEKMLSDIGATDVVTTEDGNKKFAYPINKKWSGFYVSVNFELPWENGEKIVEVEKKINLSDIIIRFLMINQTEALREQAKEQLNENPEFTGHRDMNKGKATTKKDLSSHLGKRVFDFRDVEYLEQFTSPYAKIFKRNRTGNQSKNQRRIAQAIKRARHMALMRFTTKHDH